MPRVVLSHSVLGLLVAAMALTAAGCGESAPSGQLVDMPASVLEDARRSDAAYDEAAKSKGRKARSPEPTSPGAPS